MLAVGTKVYHSGHGNGTIVAHNAQKANSYAAENLGSGVTAAAVRIGLSEAIVSSFYDGSRFPYVVQFDSGYKDVCAESNFSNKK